MWHSKRKRKEAGGAGKTRSLGVILLVSVLMFTTLAMISMKNNEVLSMVNSTNPLDSLQIVHEDARNIDTQTQRETEIETETTETATEADGEKSATATPRESSQARESARSRTKGGSRSRQQRSARPGSRANPRASRASRASGETPSSESSSSRQDTTTTTTSSSSSSSSNRRRHRREKENINRNAADFDQITKEILSQLRIPKTEPYRHQFPTTRLVVNKGNPNNRLAHTQQEKSLSNLPDKDIEERFGSCAVIGNSGLSLFNENQGEAIDKHDVVIRFNDGPTAGFEKYVGSKTSYRFVNNNWSRYYTRRQPRGCTEEALMMFGNGAVRFLHALTAKYKDLKKIYFMAPEFALNARGTYKKAYAVMDESGYMRVKGRNSPPTGIEGVFFGLEMCDIVDLYGFQIANDPKIKYHYHNEVKGVEAAHSFGFQYEFLKVLMHGGFIRVCLPEDHTGSCLTGIATEAETNAEMKLEED